MKAFKTLTAPVLVLSGRNIDTDQIIPARFLTVTRFEGLAEGAFADWRFDDQGREKAGCVLNEPRAKSSPILVAGRNFGCGSSREHAPRALMEFGFRVVISCEIADIFRNNSHNVGLLPVVLKPQEHQVLLNMDGREVTVDLEQCQVQLGEEQVFSFEIDAFARFCLLKGMDRLDYLMDARADIETYEVKHEHQGTAASR
jgi:3-isopropylmalate/(R)-2-methylmalate dehydratase small subunit